MTPPKIDLTDPATVCAEIFDDDRWIKDEFAKHLSADILTFSEAIAESFRLFPWDSFDIISRMPKTRPIRPLAASFR